VDDEEPVLESYEFMLRGSAAFALAGKAQSGYEALKLIHELEPDLVFMDINIPGLDGLEVIADVHKKFPAMIFVLSTAYERFDLAQRAIPLGVFAYLVKPVSKKTFLETLDTVREELRNREGAEAETAEQRFFRKTIWRELSEAEWESCREGLSLPSDKGIAFLLELEEDPERYCARLAEKVSYRHYCRYDVLLNRGLFLVCEDIRRETLRDQLEAACKEIFAERPGYFWGMGELHRGPELYLSCGEALRDLENKRKGTDIQRREQMRIIQLRRKMRIADREELKKLFAVLWKEFFTFHGFTLAKVKMVSVFMFLLDDCTGCYGGNSETLPLFAPAEEIMAIPDMARWESWASAAFDKILLQAGPLRKDIPFPLAKALEHVHRHYAESGLQLQSAADAAGISAAYLSRLFSEHLKTSFIDYVTELRMEDAEKLIRETKMNIKEIAFAAGYQDPNYFSKLFRKITGVSPRIYAEEFRGEGI
jgi:two-component system response regulator YesN